MNDKEFFSDDEVLQLCLSAFEDEERLDDALRAIYQKGFEDTPQVDNAGNLFVRRLKDVRAEYRAQLEAYQEDPKQWEKRQLVLAEDADAMVCGLCLLTAQMHGEQWLQEQCLHLLDLRMAQAPLPEGDRLELMHQFIHTPMASIFAGGEVARISPSIAPQFASILAMLSYVFVKQTKDMDILPDLSFDAVCIGSHAMTDSLCMPEAAPTSALATVCSLMMVQYMHIPEWEILKKIITSIKALMSRVMYKVMDTLRQKLLPRLQNKQLYQVEWVWPEATAAKYKQSSWLSLLENQLERGHAGTKETDEAKETVAEAEKQEE